MGAGRGERRPDGGVLVDGQVVEDDDIARAQRRHQDLVDIRLEGRRVDRAVKHRRGGQPVEPQRGDHGMCLPVAARRVIVQAGAARTAAIPAQQIGRDATLIEEDVLADIAQGQPVAPLAPRRRDIRTALFVGVYRFF